MAKAKKAGAIAQQGNQTVGVQPPAFPGLVIPPALKHVVVIIQENRSFDQYYGLLPGVRGFYDTSGKFAQEWPRTSKAKHADVLYPFEMSPTKNPGAIKHSWNDMHGAWDNGALDAWLSHKSTAPVPFATMGYYTPESIPYHTALATNFTLCDHYFAGVLSSTASNRVMLMSGTIDPTGKNGGPLTGDPSGPPGPTTQKYKWKSYPEQLFDAGVDFAIYEEDPTNQPGSGSTPTHPKNTNWTMNLAAYFTSWPKMLASRSTISRTGANDFEYDAAHCLPKVSWIIPPYEYSEHPDYSPLAGEHWLAGKIAAVLEHHWSDTAIILTYDECGACFDHVPPPAPKPGTAGEWITTGSIYAKPGSSTINSAGPGFRVPCTIISPWTVGGRVVSNMYDHTSVLRFLSSFTGVASPNISAYRMETFGNLITAFDFANPPAAAAPSLPTPPSASWKTSPDVALPKFPQKWPPPKRL